MKLTNIIRRYARVEVRRLIPVFAIAIQFVWLAPAAATDAPAGEFGFVIGQVAITGGDGRSRLASPGEPVFVGDIIETGVGEHVHVRFVDQGFVSVRPGSRLTVDAYSIEPDATEVRFSLTHGVVRAITGEAAKRQRERFRMNAPMAAIGVRGTDFVVKSAGSALQAVVNSGAIVVAPFGADCVTTSLGPCNSADAVELSDVMGRVLLEMTELQTPRILPLQTLPGTDEAPNGEPPLERDLANLLDVEPALERDLVSVVGGASADKAEGSFLPDQDLLVKPDLAALTQLAWGRWAGGPRQGDTLTVVYGDARDGRDITVGNAYAGLFRQPDGVSALTAGAGGASFIMAGAHVDFIRGDGAISPGAVESGTLKIDFTQRSFDTALTLSHVEAGRHQFGASGTVAGNGVFSARSDQQRIAGAVSFDGREAGYLFEQNVSEGVFSGVTLWAR